MMARKIFVLLSLLVAANSKLAFAVPEIPSTTIPDIAITSWWTGSIPILGIPMYNGPVIFYNPNAIQQFDSDLTAFFYAHEYCHVTLNHVPQIIFFGNPYNQFSLRQSLEIDADTCATKSLFQSQNFQAIFAIAQWFDNQYPVQFSLTHPLSKTRAINIKNVARSLGMII